MLQVRQPKHFYMQLHASVCDLKHSTWFDDDLWREPGQQRLSDPMIFDSRRSVTCLCWNIHFQMQNFSLSQTIRNTVKTHQDKAVICGLCLCCLARLNNWCLLRILLCFFLQLSDQSFFFFFFPTLVLQLAGLHGAWRKVTTFGLPLITLRHARN